jgi:sulfur carrier protein ThiS adenylyltransferase
MMSHSSSTSTGPLTDRFSRQRGLIATELVRRQQVTIIGVGAIGRNVTLQLASLGVGTIQLIDFDVVDDHNVTSQGFLAAEIGRTKVEAVANTIAGIDSAIATQTACDRFRPNQKVHPVVFCCVDSISARATIWKTLSIRCEFWADGRMLGEVIRILTVSDNQSRRLYGSTLFAQSEAQVGSCTSSSTIYGASIAAGLLVHQFTRYLRGLSCDADLQFNLLASELNVVDQIVGHNVSPASS